MSIPLIIFLILLILVLSFLIKVPSTATESIVIKAKADEIYEALIDFNLQEKWSPWLIADKNIKLETNNTKKVGASQQWKSEFLGEGKITMIELEKNKFIKNSLQFLKPMKSKATTLWTLEETDKDEVQITWQMKYPCPLIINLLISKVFKALIKSDFQRGLALLKIFIEEKDLKFSLSEVKETEIEEVNFISYEQKSNLKVIAEDFEEIYKKIDTFMKEKKIDLKGKEGQIFARYKNCNFTTGDMNLEVCFPVNELPKELPSSFSSSSLEKAKVLELTLTGDYRYLSSAWFVIHNYAKAKKVKVDRKTGFEFYDITRFDHSDNPEKWLTRVSLLVK